MLNLYNKSRQWAKGYFYPYWMDLIDYLINFNVAIFKINQMASKESLKQRFESSRSKKLYNGIKMNREVSEILTFMENTIKKQTESFSLFNSLCGAQRRINITPFFQTSFLSLSIEEKTNYYQVAITSLIEKQKETSINLLAQNEAQFQTLPIKIHKGLKTGPSYKIKLTNYALDCSHYEIPLRNYILRKSNKNKQIFVFQSLIKQEPLKIRFQIINYSSAKDNALVQQNNKYWAKYLFNLNKVEEQEEKPKVKLSKRNKEVVSELDSPSKKTITNIEIQSKKNISPVQNFQNEELQRSVVEEIFTTKKDQLNAQQEIYQIIEQKQLQISRQQSKNSIKGYRKNIARVILPHLSLMDIQNFGDYLPVVRDDPHRLYIYQHSVKKQQFRLELYIKQNSQIVVKHLCEIQNYKLWNGSINESHVKLSITSDNSYLAYFKQRSYSNLYRERDFLFLRHLCRVEQTFYFVDCSIQNSHFIPFQSIIRGNINYCLTKIQKFNGNQCRLLMQLNIDHAGLLKPRDDVSQELTLTFLKEFIGLQSYITRFKGQFKNPYDLNWQINLSNEQVQILHDVSQSNFSISSTLFQQGDELASFGRNDDEDDEFYSIADEQQQQVALFEITEQELKQKFKKQKEMKISYTSSEKIELDKEGLVILPKAYLKVRHVTAPIKVQYKKKKNPFTHLMLKNDFVQDNGGGMKLQNPQKEAAQNNVIKFVMNTLKKNLFAGKGILNISLPVQIFNCDSNIQRFCQSLSMAPDLIQRRKSSNPIERFKNCVAFAFTNSVLYFDMDKAFNPILGETFQGFIDGCPTYAQQISHHPPISSIYMIGRGYKIYGNIEAKVYVHLNSGEGVNEGFYTIQFDDGGKVVYQTAPGEVSGLVVGNRKFRFKGKTFIVDAKNRLFCSINFEDQSSGLFSKSKWKYSDQFDGEVVRVSESFIRSFFQKAQGRDSVVPGKKDIEQRLGKVNGRWLQSFKIDDEEYFNLKESPFEMVHYEFPLNSNSDYREDLYYRKMNDLARSQSQKERLQVKQRYDRKFREKYTGKH